jgi:hypothetical protein
MNGITMLYNNKYKNERYIKGKIEMRSCEEWLRNWNV